MFRAVTVHTAETRLARAVRVALLALERGVYTRQREWVADILTPRRHAVAVAALTAVGVRRLVATRTAEPGDVETVRVALLAGKRRVRTGQRTGMHEVRRP